MASSYYVPRPQSLDLAQLALGAQVATWYPDLGNWFTATVAEVSRPEELDPGDSEEELAEPGTLWLLLQYPAQKGQKADQEDLEWDEVFNHAPIFNSGVDTGKVCAVKWASLGPGILGRLGAVLAPEPAALQHLPRAWAAPHATPVGGKRKQAQEPDVPGSKRSKPRKQLPKKASQPTAVSAAAAVQAGRSDWGLPQEQCQALSSSQPLPRGDSDSSVMHQAGPSQHHQRGPAAKRRPQGRKRQVLAESEDEDGDFQQPPGPSQLRTHATQTVEVQTRPGEGTAGQLKSCELINFMCHARYTMTFGPHVNIISGTNGSGKSAVLQALQCCMGVKAHATGRFKSAKEFIRHGQDHAVVTVEMWNTGPDAYQPELLGRVLTVERRITRAGGNTFSIKNSKGVVVLRGTKELEKLLEAVSVNAANPAVIMTQDTARSFAGEHSEKKKYEVFVEAMQLDEIYRNLMSSGDDIADIQVKLDKDEEILAERERELRDKQQLLETLRAVHDWKAEANALDRCMFWQSVKDSEHRKESLTDILQNRIPAKLEAEAVKATTLQQQQDALSAERARQHARLEELSARLRGQQEELHVAKQGHKRTKDQLHKLQRDLRERQHEVRELEGERDDLVASVREVDDDYIKATQADMEGFKQRMQASKAACEEAKAAIQAAKGDIEEKKAAVDAAAKEVETADEGVRTANNNIRRVQEELRRLERSQGDKLQRFGGDAMKNFLQRIEAAVRQGKFQRPPVGPIGASLALEDDQWAVAVEPSTVGYSPMTIADFDRSGISKGLLAVQAALGRVLDSFVVHCLPDQKLLQKMARDARMSVGCFICSFDMPQHQLPPERLPPASVLTIMKVLKFENIANGHVVKNVLVDQGRIERTVLAVSDKEKATTLRDRAFMNRYKISSIWTRDGGQGRNRGSTETLLAANENLRPRLMKDVSTFIDQCRQDLAEKQREGHEKQALLNEAREYEVQARRALMAAHHAMKTAKHREAQTQAQLNTLASQRPVQVDPAEGANDTAVRVAELQNRIAEEQVRVAELEAAVGRAKQESEEAAQHVHQVAEAPKAMQEEIETCAAALTRVAEQSEGVQAQLDEGQKAVEALRAKQQENQAKLHECIEKLAVQTELALQCCSREEALEVQAQLRAGWQADGKSEEEITAMLLVNNLKKRAEQLEQKIKRREENAGVSVVDLERIVTDLEDAYADHEASHQTCTRLYSKLHSRHQARVQKYKRNREMVASLVSRRFHENMKKRQHLAHIKVDYQEERLIFHVGVNGGEPVTDMKSLSGGERSMTTICFLMALGHAGLCPPFVALDEFDVFMDPVNRLSALVFLLDFALTYKDRQFLFLTPQDISAVQEAKAHVRAILRKQRGPDTDLPNKFVRVSRISSARANADQA